MTTQQQQPNGTTDTAPQTGATAQLLPLSFNRYGYHIHQLQRNEYAALYEVTDILTGSPQGFEVFCIKIQQERTTASGIHFALKERYPSAEDFGQTAKAPRTLDRASQLFNEYSERARKKAERANSKAEIAKISDDTPEWIE